MELKLRHSIHLPHFAGLLIVPYGIETREKKLCRCGSRPFNRTLWN